MRVRSTSAGLLSRFLGLLLLFVSDASVAPALAVDAPAAAPADALETAAASVMTALKRKDRAAFDAALAGFERAGEPVARLKHYGPIARELARDDRESAEAMLRGAMNNPAYNARHRYDLLIMLRGLHRVRAFNYQFHEPGAYERFKALALEELAAVERGLAEGTIGSDRNLALRTYHDIAQAAADFGDYAFAGSMLSEARRICPLEYRFVPLALRLALRANDMQAVRDIAGPVIENPDEKAENRQFLKGVLHVSGGAPLDRFGAAVFGEETVAPAELMLMLRRVSEVLFLAGRYGLCQDIREYTFAELFSPIELKRYRVEYAENPPRTADAWARSELYDRWKLMETRFVPYGDGYDMNNRTDQARHLKDVQKPQVDPAYRTGVQIVCDRTGLHIFIRCDDPDPEEIVLGKRRGDGLELLFRPGDDAAYHSWYFDGPPSDTGDPHLVNWATPTRRYRLTYDFFEKDAVATPAGFAAHTFIPWLAVHDKLPVGGNVWRFGMQRWGKAGSTLSGLVHEQERALRLEFDFTPQQLATIKRTVATIAFNRYDAIRQDKGGCIQTWNDAKLGDPEFYESEVRELIAELDAAGAKLAAAALDAEIAAIYERYVPLWAEIDYIIAGRRAAYLKRRLLGLSENADGP